jgi:hypothetical protein
MGCLEGERACGLRPFFLTLEGCRKMFINGVTRRAAALAKADPYPASLWRTVLYASFLGMSEPCI